MFARLTAVYGAQKMQTMWAAEPVVSMDEVMSMWVDQLSRFPADAVRKGMQALIDQGRDWPPTLPEFVALCRQFRNPSHAPAALPAPGGTIDPEVGRAALAALKVVGGRRQ